MKLVARIAAVLAALLALAIWLSPRLLVVPPTVMRVLLSLGLLSGLLSLAFSHRTGPRMARWARAAGGVALGSVLLAAVVLFTLPAGPVRIQRAEPPGAAAGSATGHSGGLRVVVFNVRHGYPELSDLELRVESLTAALRALEPDLVLLQEAWCLTGHGCLAERLADELEFASVFARANGSRHVLGFEEGSAVLSRWPIRSAERWVLSPRARPWRARIALIATLELASGEALYAGSFHLENLDPAVADAQAGALARRLPEPRGLLLGGDLNRGSDTPAAHALTARGLKDVLPGAIDHLFAGSRWPLRSARWALGPEELESITGQPIELSDHPALLVELEPGDPG